MLGRKRKREIKFDQGVPPRSLKQQPHEHETHETHNNDQMKSLALIPQIAENFDVLSVLGSGTFSTVFKVRLRKTDATFAIKSLVQTCKPRYIERELECLISLRGINNCCKLLGVIRNNDSVLLILDHCHHDNFLDYYQTLNTIEVRDYAQALLKAVDHVHTCGIIHRDIKPQNFLYNARSKRYMLVDFGLAQFVGEDGVVKDPQNCKAPPCKPRPSAVSAKTSTLGLAARIGPAESDLAGKLDKRKHINAMRAGTRGFRAPEVLLHVKDQSPALDIWSVGVILLTILSGRSPFFAAASDTDCLSEIAALFGHPKLDYVAEQLGKEILYGTADNVGVGYEVNGVFHPWEKVGKDYNVAEYLQKILSGLAPTHPCHKNAPLEMYQLIADLLEVHPGKRPPAHVALRHRFFSL